MVDNKVAVDEQPYVILRTISHTQLQHEVVKYMGWGYSLSGKTFQDKDEYWVQVVTKIK